MVGLDMLLFFNPMSLSHLISYRSVTDTSLTACQILVQYTHGDRFVSFYSGSTPSQMNLTKSQENVPVRVRYGCFKDFTAVSGCKQTALLCRTKKYV